MGMSVVTNVAALHAHRSLSTAGRSMATSLERLSSGLRINRAADDAAGLAISQGLRSQVTGLGQAVRNTQDGISLVRTAEGALDAVTSVLQRMRDLSVQAANDGGLTAAAKAVIQDEVTQLKAELSRIGAQTTFNGRRLLDGTYRGTFQVGANRGETVTVVIGHPGLEVGTAGLGLSSVDVTIAATHTATATPAVSDAEAVPTAGRLELAGDFVTDGIAQANYRGLVGTITYEGRDFDLGSVDYSGAVTVQQHLDRLNIAALAFFGTPHTPLTATSAALRFSGETPGIGSTAADAVALSPTYTGRSGASAAISMVDGAVEHVSSLRAYLGAIENRFQHTINRLNVTMANTASSVSRIRDTDMAQEMSSFTRSQILSQAGTAMLSQASQTPRNVLSLLV